MIIFELACAHGHRFEGWFASAEDFARQVGTDLVRCPICDDAKVARVPSAKVRGAAKKRRTKASEPSAPPESPAAAETTDALAGLPAELVQKLRDVVRNTENVGRRFAEEARKIHYEEVPARPIRGQASREEAKSLQEEGIDFASLPLFLTRDIH